MGTTAHASTPRSVSYTGHIEAAGAITLIRVSHNPSEDPRSLPHTSHTGGECGLYLRTEGVLEQHGKPQVTRKSISNKNERFI